MSAIIRRAGIGAVSLSILFFAALTRADDITRPLDRATVLELAVRAHPALAASEERAQAMARRGDAERALPPPETMIQLWQVPLAKPYAIPDAQMIMVGVSQSFPAPGARGARARAAQHEAEAERAVLADRKRLIRRDVDHAFADYVEATSRHGIHLEHRRVAARTVDLARARHKGGAALSDAVQAEVELARIDADVITDGTRIEAARGRLNALLARDPLAPLGSPIVKDPEVAAWDLRAALDTARRTRPEVNASAAIREARREDLAAAEKEALIPSFGLAALYFAPTNPLPQHGYGINASMSLPWLWGEARARRDAARHTHAAATKDAAAAHIAIDAEVAEQEAKARAGALRLAALRDRALPASRRAFDVAWAGYESARVDALTLLSARRMVVDIETEIVMARALLDHALADLEAAVGAEIPRRPLGTLANDTHTSEGSDER
ncbi:MAG: TolC family protein [Deltaproteobacteria bacterium]|nr:TolC family protein [Deltaproteobacteria bacterium]